MIITTLILMTCGCANKQGSTGIISDLNNLNGPRSKILMDYDWRFIRGDVDEGQRPDLNDVSWRKIDLPHDWSIEDIPGTDSPHDSAAIGGISTGYFSGGTAWYRKKIDLPSDLKDKRFNLLFEGVYMDSEIWVNGKPAGNHPYGYTSFWFDITDQLEFGTTNTIAVKVKNEGKNSRWYSGSGIYRHVWLTITEPVHVSPWGVGIRTQTDREGMAQVLVNTNITNEGGENVRLNLHSLIYSPSGSLISADKQEIEAIKEGKAEVTQEIEIPDPDLWSPDSPALYKLVTEVRDEKSNLLDILETSFGIRSIEFTSEGFFLNGENLYLKGGCMHHDKGILGAASYDRAEERSVEIMKENGYNSIRCAHNPPSPAFLNACDRLGIMVIDEAFDMWRRPKNPQDYHRFFDEWWKTDIESMVLRDRNHPSVIMWSSGNEIPERGDPEGVETSIMLTEYIHELDPTRPVTSAVNGLTPDKDPYFGTLDIAGYNYAFGGDHGRESIYETDHQRVPERIIYCSESYPLTAFGAWMDVLDYPWVIGDFVWTGYDYLGEASIGWLGYPHEGSFYPWNHAYCGDIDICGMKRPQSFYRDVLWNNGERLSLFVYSPEPSFKENPDRKDWCKWHWQDVSDRWNWKGYEDKLLQVEAYSAYENAELFLNGKSYGIRETNRDTEWIARWKVPYAPGTLKVIAYQNGKEVKSSELRTAGDPGKIKLTPDRTEIKANRQDLSYILVELTDRQGNRSRIAENKVEFSIEGPGTILAVGNSNPMSTESYRQPYRKAYGGRCLVVVKSSEEPGEIILKASSEGLEPGEVKIRSL